MDIYMNHKNKWNNKCSLKNFLRKKTTHFFLANRLLFVFFFSFIIFTLSPHDNPFPNSWQCSNLIDFFFNLTAFQNKIVKFEKVFIFKNKVTFKTSKLMLLKCQTKKKRKEKNKQCNRMPECVLEILTVLIKLFLPRGYS